MSPNVTNVDGSFWNKTIPSNMLTVFCRSKVTRGIDFDSSANSFDLAVFDNFLSAFANDSGKCVNSNCKVSFKSMSWSFCISKSCAKVSQSESEATVMPFGFEAASSVLSKVNNIFFLIELFTSCSFFLILLSMKFFKHFFPTSLFFSKSFFISAATATPELTETSSH